MVVPRRWIGVKISYLSSFYVRITAFLKKVNTPFFYYFANIISETRSENSKQWKNTNTLKIEGFIRFDWGFVVVALLLRTSVSFVYLRTCWNEGHRSIFRFGGRKSRIFRGTLTLTLQIFFESHGFQNEWNYVF